MDEPHGSFSGGGDRLVAPWHPDQNRIFLAMQLRLVGSPAHRDANADNMSPVVGKRHP